MSYLLDTHYILWTLFEPNKLDNEICAIFQDETIIKYVSAISFWEISLKYSLGKLHLSESNPDEVFDRTLESGFEVLSVSDRIFSSYYQLPKKDNHKDPFDRLLIWQAIQHDYTLITQDSKISDYVGIELKVRLGR